MWVIGKQVLWPGLYETPRSFRAFTVEIKMKDLNWLSGPGSGLGLFSILTHLGAYLEAVPVYFGPLSPVTQSSEENSAPKNPSPDHSPGPGLGLHHLKLSPILPPQPPSSQQVVTASHL